MSLRAPSLVGLLGVLQRAGLTYAQMAAFAAACQAQHNGSVVFRVSNGHIYQVEVRESERPRRLAHD